VSTINAIREACVRLNAAGITGTNWALVLGTGLSEHGDACRCTASLETETLPGFAPAAVPGHPGRIELRRYDDVPVLTFCVRNHLYEGHGLEPVIAPARVAAELGVARIVFVSAIGGISEVARAAGYVAVHDYIVATPDAELSGIWELSGVLTPKETQPVFDAALLRAMESAARREDLPAARGVLAWCRGPQFETAAEIAVLAQWGVDGVGMSMVPEAIAARRLGLAVAGLGVVTNAATGLAEDAHDHAQVAETARSKTPEVARLLARLFNTWP